MIMSADHKIDLPVIGCITEYKTIRSVAQHNLVPVCILKLLQKIPYITCQILCTVISIQSKCIFIHPTDTHLTSTDLHVPVTFFQHTCAGICKILHQFGILRVLLHLLPFCSADIIQFMIPKRIIHRRNLCQTFYQSDRHLVTLRILIQHIAIQNDHLRILFFYTPDQLLIVFTEFMIMKIRKYHHLESRICNRIRIWQIPDRHRIPVHFHPMIRNKNLPDKPYQD